MQSQLVVEDEKESLTVSVSAPNISSSDSEHEEEKQANGIRCAINISSADDDDDDGKQAQPNGKEGRSAKSVPTYSSGSMMKTSFVSFFWLYAITTGSSIALLLERHETVSLIGNYVYYAGLIFYQICVLLVSYLAYENVKAIRTSKTNHSWNERIFYTKFLLCSLFNLITCILLFGGILSGRVSAQCVSPSFGGCTVSVNVLWSLIAFSYFLNVFSIPLPAIVLFAYIKTKKFASPRQATNKAAASPTSPLIPASGKKVVSVQANILAKRRMLGGICFAYFVHYLYYIMLPAMAPHQFDAMLAIMYNDQDTVLYFVNHSFLRTFKGMSLNGIFFVFFGALIARDFEANPDDETNEQSEWQCVKVCLFDNKCLYGTMAAIWLSVAVSDLLTVDPDADEGAEFVLSICWTFIHLIGVVVCIRYIHLFDGAMTKYTKRKKSRLGEGKSVDNISYAFKAVVLLLFFGAQCILLLHFDDNVFDWIRMTSIGMLALFQLVTLIQLREMQCNDEYLQWCNRGNRARNLKWNYFVFLLLLNMVDMSYVYIYGLKYYTNERLHGEAEAKTRVSYAMSFAGPAILTMCLSQLIISNAEFSYAFNEKAQRLQLGLSSVSADTAELNERPASSKQATV